MNKLLRHKYRCKWDSYNWFLEYLRDMNVYQKGFSGEPNANPYWYGTVLDFETFRKVIKDLLEKKSIKPSKLHEIFSLAEESYMSPIVKLTGLWGLREIEKIK